MGSASRVVSRIIASARIPCSGKGRLRLGNVCGETMSAICKRALDITIASAGLIVMSPLFLIIAFAIRVAMGEPVFFRQVRPGYKTRPCTVVKFRTMMGDGSQIETYSDGARLTRLGNLLRQFSLDELPQLWNVLKGEMSLVGPRPLLTEYLHSYTPEQARRHDVKPWDHLCLPKTHSSL